MPAALAAHARNLVGPLLRSTYRISTINADAIPPRGPVLILCDWNNIAAPSVIKAAVPRPVHVWADGPAAVPGPLLSVTGDLAMPVTKIGVEIVNRAVILVGSGEAVCAIGVEDLGYVLARSQAPVVPVHVAAPETKRPTDPPARKSPIVLTMGGLRVFPQRLRTDRVSRISARAAGEWARQILVDSREPS